MASALGIQHCLSSVDPSGPVERIVQPVRSSCNYGNQEFQKDVAPRLSSRAPGYMLIDIRRHGKVALAQFRTDYLKSESKVYYRFPGVSFSQWRGLVLREIIAYLT
jgi:hypothetical protein